MAWFNFLKKEGYFAPKNNPDPVRGKNGFQVPYWEILNYLEKLSIEISKGNDIEFIDKILEIIKNVSEHPRDNHRTWHVFIKILSNLPNEKISKEILNFIPVWLMGDFDTMLQTSELCDSLLPKFLNEEPTEADIEKAELILDYLFQVNKTEKSRYSSRLYLYHIAEPFKKKDFISKIMKYCSRNFIFKLGRTIKFILLNYPEGVNTILKDGEKEYEIKIIIEEENLLISSKLVGNLETIHAPLILENWENKNESSLKQELILLLKKQGINYVPNETNDDTFAKLSFALNTDLNSAFGFNSISKLDDRHSNSEDVLDVFSLIFRDLLNERAKQNSEETISLLNTFCFDKKYGLPFYKRIAIYIIRENWSETKSFFWELIKDTDSLRLFSDSKYQKGLYDLLSINQQALLKEETKMLLKVIEQGAESEKHKEHWQLRWYAALKDVEPFKEKYQVLSKLLNISHEYYENLGEVRISSGSVSPISKDDFLEKSNQDILDYLKVFKPGDGWEKPNISGLSSILGSAVEEEPEKFANEIELYQNIAYIYSYRMLNAFSEAWKKQKSFDWEKVLHYCLDTLNSQKFNSGELKIENDGWNATANWVIDSIANLLTSGLRNHKNAIDIHLLPLVKKVIEKIVINLKRVDDFKGDNKDYLTYMFNSTAGHSLGALLDYSLYRAKHFFKNEDEDKWESDIKVLFEGALEKGILDANIMEGVYFKEFYYLDKNWITKRVQQHYQSKEREWLAFIGGFAFGNPPGNKDLYTLFYPHYEKVIDDNIGFHNDGLIKHLTAFYFWKYETLSSQKLLFKFLNDSTPEKVQHLIKFIGRQEDYQANLLELEQEYFQQIILELWKNLLEKYASSINEKEQKNLATLSNWIVFVSELNDTYSELILNSCKYIKSVDLTHNLLINLIRLKNKGNTKVTAKYIGEIILQLFFDDYFSDSVKDLIKELISFLFANEQREIAATFCNRIASDHQQFFLKEIWGGSV